MASSSLSTPISCCDERICTPDVERSVVHDVILLSCPHELLKEGGGGGQTNHSAIICPADRSLTTTAVRPGQRIHYATLQPSSRANNPLSSCFPRVHSRARHARQFHHPFPTPSHRSIEQPSHRTTHQLRYTSSLPLLTAVVLAVMGCLAARLRRPWSPGLAVSIADLRILQHTGGVKGKQAYVGPTRFGCATRS